MLCVAVVTALLIEGVYLLYFCFYMFGFVCIICMRREKNIITNDRGNRKHEQINLSLGHCRNGGHEHTIWWIWVRNPFAALAAERHDVTLTIHMPTSHEINEWCCFCPNLILPDVPKIVLPLNFILSHYNTALLRYTTRQFIIHLSWRSFVISYHVPAPVPLERELKENNFFLWKKGRKTNIFIKHLYKPSSISTFTQPAGHHIRRQSFHSRDKTSNI